MRAVRLSLGGLGALVGLYGAYLLLSRQDGAQLRSAGMWLVGGVVVHDGMLALVVIALTVLVGRFLTEPARAPVMVAVVVLGSVTLLAVPMLGVFGEKADNATLLDRNYWAGWLGFVSVVVVSVVVASLVRARSARRAASADSVAGLD